MKYYMIEIPYHGCTEKREEATTKSPVSADPMGWEPQPVEERSYYQFLFLKIYKKFKNILKRGLI